MFRKNSNFRRIPISNSDPDSNHFIQFPPDPNPSSKGRLSFLPVNKRSAVIFDVPMDANAVAPGWEIAPPQTTKTDGDSNVYEPKKHETKSSLSDGIDNIASIE